MSKDKLKKLIKKILKEQQNINRSPLSRGNDRRVLFGPNQGIEKEVDNPDKTIPNFELTDGASSNTGDGNLVPYRIVSREFVDNVNGYTGYQETDCDVTAQGTPEIPIKKFNHKRTRAANKEIRKRREIHFNNIQNQRTT